MTDLLVGGVIFVVIVLVALKLEKEPPIPRDVRGFLRWFWEQLWR